MATADPQPFHRFVAAAAEGKVRVPVDRVLGFDEIHEGLEWLASGQA